MFAEIGAFDAKAKLSELLRAVQQGQRFTITVRGKPVADLVPCAGAADVAAISDAIAAIRALPRVAGIRDADFEAALEEGRRS